MNEVFERRVNEADGRMPVTVLGLGPMGQALAGAFLSGGHPTTVWNRSAGKSEALVARGAKKAASPADAVAASPLTMLDAGAALEVLSQAEGGLKGRTVVNLTSDSPDRSRKLAAWAAEQGADFLDGAIMTPTGTIGTSAAVVMYSGPKAVYEAFRPALANIGGSASYLGEDPGRAAAYDVALLDVFWTAMSGYVHALALARAENIAARELEPYAQGIAAILPPIMAEFARHADKGEYPGSQSNHLSAAAGMEHIIHSSESHGIEAGVLKTARAVARRAIDSGHGRDAFSRLAETLRERIG